MCIERIVDLNQMHLSVESKIEAADAHKRSGYLSESNFINLYTFAGVLNGMWSCVDEWKKDKETGSMKSSCRTRNAYWKMFMNWESTAFAKKVRMPIF